MTRRWFMLLLMGTPLVAPPLLAVEINDIMLERICGQSFQSWPELDKLLQLQRLPENADLENSPVTRLILHEAYQIKHGLGWRAVPWASPPGRLPTQAPPGLNRWGQPNVPAKPQTLQPITKLTGPPLSVLVIGSGIAGALTGWKLAQSGFKVTIVEAGPEVNRAQALQSYTANLDPAKTYPHALGQQPRWGDELAYYQQQGPEIFGGVYERMAGGTTWHWIGTCLRLLESDFKLRTRYGVGCDWPIGLSDLLAYYQEAELELGVSGSIAMPPLQASYLDQQVAKAAKHHQLNVRVLPAARNSTSYRGRPACQGHASCFPICPIGAKYDASIHIALAKQLGAKVECNTRARRIIHKNGSVSGIEIDGPAGPSLLKADRYVLAANAVETPRLLLFSGLDRFPTGRFLMGMSGQVSWALAPKPVWPYRAPQVISGITDLRDGPWRKQRAASLISIGNDGWPGHSPPELANRFIREGLIGRALVAKIRDHASRQLLLVSNCEELGLAENRISLSDNLDSNGIPKPRVNFRIGQYTKAAIDHSVLVHARIFDKMNASEIHHVEESSDPAHIAGTCRMGDDPRQSVVDKNLRWHDLDNLYVVGSSVFPSVGSAPPTLTIAALALRLAYSLAKTKSS